MPGIQVLFATAGTSCGPVTKDSCADVGHTSRTRGVIFRFPLFFSFLSVFLILQSVLPNSCVVLFSDPRPEEVMLPTREPVLSSAYHYSYV